MGVSVYVSIGRNVGDDGPMDDAEWSAFRSDVVDILTGAGYRTVSACEGFGEYAGAREACAVIVADDNGWIAAPSGAVILASVRDALAWTAHRYGQDAIALTIGAPEFIGAPRGARVDDAAPVDVDREDRFEGSLAAIYAAPPGAVDY